MTRARFAQLASRLAKDASSWSADALDLDGEMRPEDVRRFVQQMRERLDWMVETINQ